MIELTHGSRGTEGSADASAGRGGVEATDCVYGADESSHLSLGEITVCTREYTVGSLVMFARFWGGASHAF